MSHVLRPLQPNHLLDATPLLGAACRYERADDVAEEKIFGEAAGAHGVLATGAWLDERLVGLVVGSDCFVRLLAVHRGHRRQGVGTALLNHVETQLRGLGAPRVRTAAQPGNYLAPGIDSRDTETLVWLKKRGYEEIARNHNLIIDVVNNVAATEERRDQLVQAVPPGYDIRRIANDETAEVLLWIERTFSQGWAFETGRAAAREPRGVHVAWFDHRPVAFATHDGNNRGLGWFGPLGTAAEHRGRGLAAALFVACLVDIRAAGHRQSEVAWIGPRGFYDQLAGIAGEREFVVLQKRV